MSDSAGPVLIEAAIKGDEPAFAELVRRYQAAVWGAVYRTLGNSSEGEDAVQEIFLRVLVSLPRFDRQLPFGPWILRIASNYCIDQLRRRKTRKYRLWSDLTEAEAERIANKMVHKPDVGSTTVEDPAAYLEVARSLLDQLKPKRRMAFVLREIEGRSYAAVAKILGVPEVTARVRVWRARADLHQEFCRYLAKQRGGTRNEKAL